jgi:hypothetical protein
MKKLAHATKRDSSPGTDHGRTLAYIGNSYNSAHASRGPTRSVHIYALCDVDGSVRYVGRTTDPHGRLDNHLRDRRGNRSKSRWIAGLAAIGRRPAFVLLDLVPGERGAAAELRWINRLGRRFELLNIHGVRRVPLVPRSFEQVPPELSGISREEIAVGMRHLESEPADGVAKAKRSPAEVREMLCSAFRYALHATENDAVSAAHRLGVTARSTLAWRSGRGYVNSRILARDADLFRSFLDALVVAELRESGRVEGL